MSVPSIVKGQYWDVAVDVTSLGLAGLTGFVIICGLNTKSLTHQVNTNDEAVRDCEQPEQVPWRVVNTTSQQKDMSGTGLHNRAQTNVIRAIFGQSLPYRIIEGEPGADLVSQGYWEGPFVFTNWQEGATDGTNVSSQMTWVSDGQVDWISSTAPSLATLGLTPLTATVSTLWTGTVTGVAAGSTVAATTPGITLTVTGTGTTRTITGTWPTTGSKVVTLIETNAKSPDSPKTGTKTVVVS